MNENEIEFGKHDPANLEEVTIWTKNLISKDPKIKEIPINTSN